MNIDNDNAENQVNGNSDIDNAYNHNDDLDIDNDTNGYCKR